jgi:hypothetical protein
VPQFKVVVVDGLTDTQFRDLAARGAVGLLVPGVGPVTNRRYSIASLVRGLAVNPYLGTLPKSRPLFGFAASDDPLDLHDAIVVALPPDGPPVSNDRRYPIAVIGHGFHGLLTSVTTRIPGLVSVVDIAPTALAYPRGSLGWTRVADPVSTLDGLDGRIHANNRLKLPALIIIACALLLLARLRPRAGIPAILAALLSSLAAGALQISNEPALIAVVVIGTVGGGWLIGQLCTDDRRVLAAIVLVLLAHVVLLVVRPDWVAITPLGPTQNSRFWGIGNQLETLLLAPLVAGSALAARRYGAVGFSVFALLSLVLVTDNRLGSDGGGAIVFAVALAYTGARFLRLGARGFVTLLLLNGTLGLGVIWLNLRVPGPDHLRSAFAHGLSGLWSVVVDRVPLAYLPALHQWPVLTPLAILFALALVGALLRSDPRTRDLVLAAALAIATSLLLNDSASYELAGGAAVIAALARFSVPARPIVLPAAGAVQFAPHPVRSEE